MIGRVLGVLRRRAGAPAEPPLRPNELRLDVVRAERLRREASRARRSALPAPRSPEEQIEPAEQVVESRPTRGPGTPPPLVALTTRSGLRQAWLINEVLAPPRALRGPDGEAPSRSGAG